LVVQVLDGPTLGSIWFGTITWWNDSAIATLNPGATLPNERILLASANDTYGGISYTFSRALCAWSSDFTAVWDSANVNWTRVAGIADHLTDTNAAGSNQPTYVKARIPFLPLTTTCPHPNPCVAGESSEHTVQSELHDQVYGRACRR
jgi:ABC-type phosphate transport system substrate-binding protein